MLSISAVASAQPSGPRELFEWRGNVEQEIRVQMMGGRTSVMDMGPREMSGYDNARALSSVPSVNGYVSVQMRQGRGSADVVQQPSAQNGYATIIRVRDTQSGAGSYDVAAYWQPTDNYGYGNSQYDPYDSYGQYGNYGQYDQSRDYGRYGSYPAPVIVQRPVYVNHGTVGKTLPVPARTNTDASRAYPSHVPPAIGRTGSGIVETGKVPQHSVPVRPTSPARPAGRTPPAVSHPTQPGKTLPGTVRPPQSNTAHPRVY
jgi:hypothetical protein